MRVNPRQRAYEILIKICVEGAYSNIALKEGLDEFKDLDKRFITNIVYGTLRHGRYLRYQWQDFMRDQPKEEIALLLDMSVYQFFFMRVPDYAVVDEAVEIAKGIEAGQYSTFINAILHKVQERGELNVSGSAIERKAILSSLPLWLLKMWKKQYGEETALKICDAFDVIPAQTARVNTLKTTKEAIKANNEKFIDGVIAPDALRYTQGNIAQTEEYAKGLLTVQDESAQLVTHLLDPHPGDIVLDMCAAPGGKTTHIGALMKNQGELFALDIHEHRVELIKKNCRRMGIIVAEALTMDATHLDDEFNTECFDKILLDGPCTGYGLIARKSDIRYRIKSTDMDGCIAMQARLLEESVKYLKPGGHLVYSTCTLNKKENEFQIQAFLKRHPNMVLLLERTIFPYEYDSDGFYMAKLEKTK